MTSPALAALRKQVRALAVICLGLLASTMYLLVKLHRDPAPQVLRAKRIEVLGASGKASMVFSGEQHPWSAREDAPASSPPGIWFFDEHGDEVGGIRMTTTTDARGYYAMRHLSFDARKYPQAVVLEQYEDHDRVSVGLSINDTHSPLSQKNLDRLGLPRGSTLQELRRGLSNIPDDEVELLMKSIDSSRRVFLGKQGSDVVLDLANGRGHSMLKFTVPYHGPVTLDLYDEQGKPVTIDQLQPSQQDG